MGLGTNTITLISFISSTQAVVMRFSDANFKRIFLEIRFLFRTSSSRYISTSFYQIALAFVLIQKGTDCSTVRCA